MIDEKTADEGSETPPTRTISDLVIVVTVVGSTYALSTVTILSGASLLRIPLGVFGTLFAPGYATLVAVLGTPEPDGGFDRLEWVLLSFLTSVAIVPISGMTLHFVGIGADPRTVTLLITEYTLAATSIALVRRLVFEDGAVGFRIGDARRLVGGLLRPRTNVDGALNALVVLVVLAGVVAVAAPIPGQEPPRFTEFSLLTEDESGDLVVDGYLSAMDSDGSRPIYAGITNREHRARDYTVVVQVQRAELRGRSVEVLDRREASRLGVELDHNESTRIPYEFTADGTRTGCRVAFLLYAGEVPRSPTVENAYRELHLWHATDPPADGGECTSLDALEVTATGRR